MKIVTYNVQWFKGLDNVVDIARVLNVARELADFDALCLQEVAVNYLNLTGTKQPNQPALVKQLLPGFEVFFSPAIDELSPCGTMRQQFGNLIATRLPVRQVQHTPLPYPNPPVAQPTPSMQRIALTCTVQAPWGPVRLITSHLEYYNQVMRHAQTQALRDLHVQGCALAAQPSKTEQGTPYQPKPLTTDSIICGDFNFEPDSEEYASMIQTGAECNLVNSFDVLHPGTPYPSTFRLFDRSYGPEPVGCDFFFVSDSLIHRVKRFEVNQVTQASDHQPVLLELS
ncbi:MAG: endonuclease/exonuclease/phosphatase family protein [Alcaligenaceae bacterium]|nr:endonuclease/exonuclease/phosphatase family protein [Alcaligenaceae bacterium]